MNETSENKVREYIERDTKEGPRCLHCGKYRADHRAKGLNCPMNAKARARYGVNFVDNQTYEPFVN